MERTLFEKIKNSKYADFISFAVWDEIDLDDFSAIEEDIDILNQNILIVGLNISRGVKKFQNFHVRHRGGRDSWLRGAFNRSCFRGAYMTDIIKNDVSPKQSLVDLNKNNILRNVDDFRKEIHFIECKTPDIIAIGDKTTEILQHYFLEYAESIYSIPHYAKRGIKKEEFFESVKELEGKLINKKLGK
ncbi:MAG: hypothetical protein WC297_01215 [Candidatus Paceibacterota bacterium]|jgi:hypothetical protein